MYRMMHKVSIFVVHIKYTILWDGKILDIQKLNNVKYLGGLAKIYIYKINRTSLFQAHNTKSRLKSSHWILSILFM